MDSIRGTLRQSTYSVRGVALTLLLILIFSVVPNGQITPVSAAVSSCVASLIDTTSIYTNTETRMFFQVQNTDSVPITWVKISRPSSIFTITSYSGGWVGTVNTSDVVFTGTLTPGQSNVFYVDITASSAYPATNWTVEASDNTTGTSPFACTGDTAITVSGPPPDTTPPVISNFTVSNVTHTSVAIGWTTNEAATSTVQYGTTTSYGLSETSTALLTSHSITLSNLGSNTTYNYRVSSSDSSGNTRNSSNRLFTTAIIVPTPTPQTVIQTITETNTVVETITETVTVVTTPTPSPTKRPTPTPTPDSIPPVIDVHTDFSKPFVVAPVISGQVIDVSGIATIEISLDDGVRWFDAQKEATISESVVRFSFTPKITQEGSYPVLVKAKDRSGNIRTHGPSIMILDRLEPRIGGAVVLSGHQVLTTDKHGWITAVEGISYTFVIPVIGGATASEITVSDDSQSVPPLSMPLVFDSSTGLWQAVVTFEHVGDYSLTVKAVDGVGKRATKQLMPIHVVESGKVRSGENEIVGAEVKVYAKDPESSEFKVWDGSSYGQPNPQYTGQKGEYAYLIPPGTYYLKVAAPGYRTYLSSIFRVVETTPLKTKLTLHPRRIVSVGPFRFLWPNFPWTNTVSPLTPTNVANPDDSVLPISVGVQLPFVPTSETLRTLLSKIKGQRTLVTTLTSWSPRAAEQILLLENVHKEGINVLIVFTMESQTRATLFMKQGGYTVPFIADPDGELVEPFGLQTIPTHTLIEPNGTIQENLYGLLDSMPAKTTILRE